MRAMLTEGAAPARRACAGRDNRPHAPADPVRGPAVRGRPPGPGVAGAAAAARAAAPAGGGRARRGRRVEPVAAARARAGARPGLARRQRPAALGGQAGGGRRHRRRRTGLGPAHAGALAPRHRPGEPARPGAADARRRRLARPARRRAPLFTERGLRHALGRAAALVRGAREPGRPALRLAGPRHRPQRRRAGSAATRRRGAVRRLQSEVQMLLLHAPAERRARGARPAAGQLVLAQRLRRRAARQRPSRLRSTIGLRGPALDDDWAAWAKAWETLDAGPVAAALAQARHGRRCGSRCAANAAASPSRPRPRGLGAALRSLWSRAVADRASWSRCDPAAPATCRRA